MSLLIQEEREMLTLLVMIILFVFIVKIGLRLAWGTAKFIFGLGLFWLCPLLFVLVVLLGGFSTLWLPILIVGLLFGGAFSRT